MSYEEIIIAVAKAYLDREEARTDDERARRIIREILSHIESSKEEIEDALKEILLDHLRGIYFGQVINFKEYDPPNPQLLNNIAYDINKEIFGPLIQLYDKEDNVVIVRQIVGLMYLSLELRSLVLSELKFRHEDNRDQFLLENFKYLRSCCEWVINNQRSIMNAAYHLWRACENNAANDTTRTCLSIPGEGGPVEFPTECCGEEYYKYKKEFEIFQQDLLQANKVDEGISHLQGTIMLFRIENEKKL